MTVQRSLFLMLLAFSLVASGCGDDAPTGTPDAGGADAAVPDATVPDATVPDGALPDAMVGDVADFNGRYSGTISIDCISETRPFDLDIMDGQVTGEWSASIAGGMITGTVNGAGAMEGTTTVTVRTPRGSCPLAGTFGRDGSGSGTFNCTEDVTCEGTWSVTRGSGIMPDMMARMRLTAANDRVRATRCGCDMQWFETTEICESFDTSAEVNACAQSSFMTHFDTVGTFFTCIADLNEDLADCYEAASCGAAALAACDSAADTAAMACPAVPNADASAFQATVAMCEARDVVGPAGACPDDSGAVSTTGAAVFMGSTLGAGNDLDAPAGCITARGGGGSADRAFRWSAPAAGDYTFDTLGSSFDTVIYVLSDCTGATSLGCNDDTPTGMMGDLRSSVTATLTMGQEVLVVVEGFATSNAGNFVVNINAGP